MFREMELRDLKPYPNNPRIIDEAIPLVMESIRQCGYITPIVADEDGVILAGHTRYEALKRGGVEKCSVLIAEGLTEEQKRKYRILDNKTGELASWDNTMLRSELAGIDFDGFDFGQPIDFSGIDEQKEDLPEAQSMKKTVICPRCKSEVTI